jgi:hypothetical protein
MVCAGEDSKLVRKAAHRDDVLRRLLADHV